MGRTVLSIAVLVPAVAGCSTATPVPAPPPAAPPTASTTTAPAREQAVPAYYLADTPSGPRLYREFHRVATNDPASDAVREMLRGPADPDYRSPWPAGTSLRAPVVADGGVITVDLSREARGAAPELAVQQLVFTVQAALGSTDPVRVLVDGAPVAQLFGVATTQPMRRADPYAVRSLVQIDNPGDGAALGRTVAVSGEAAVFEAVVPWEVLRGGVVVARGTAMSAQGQRFAAYTFGLTLEPGEYVVRVTEDDPSGGAGRPPFSDTKTITVG